MDHFIKHSLLQFLQLESMPFDVEFIRLMHDVHSFSMSNHIFRGYTILPVGEKPFHDVQVWP
jgi:fatty acid synthase